MAENQMIAAQRMQNRLKTLNEELRSAQTPEHRVHILKKLDPIMKSYSLLYNWRPPCTISSERSCSE